MTPSYRIDNGVAVPFPEAQGFRMLIPQSQPWSPGPLVQRTKRERRQMARSSTRGRRRARPVQPVGFAPRYDRAPPRIVLDAHQLRDHRGREALLYLPAGEAVTDEHCAAVERAMGGERR